MTTYDEFLAARRYPPRGRTVSPVDVRTRCCTWRADLVTWAVGTGRAAIWADTRISATHDDAAGWARLSAGWAHSSLPRWRCASRRSGKPPSSASKAQSCADRVK